jgi:AraC-like DNA-binding protein
MEPRIYRVTCLMAADPGSEISLEVLAQSFHLSTSRLRHLFKDVTGKSPLQYLKAQRMRKAKELLETTFLNAQEIMLRVGIKDKSHFVRDFKKIYGLSPLKYRVRHLLDEKNFQADSQDGQRIAVSANV